MYLLGIYTENTVPLLIQISYTAPNLNQNNIFIIYTYIFTIKMNCKYINLMLAYFQNTPAVHT